ncbi:uncharacterized protein LOC143475594 [Brachyhypopomus gauderio]|uniref:uncharacterized protein LOC143475594 n=1 Tax=Brachyhypopomus gauderio TaxID=698409 RepID=UPI004042AA32
MSKTEQDIKRYHCSRLCFIRLADYLIMNTMHVLAVSSISKLLTVLQDQNTHTPSHTIIQRWARGQSSHEIHTKQASVSELSAEASLLPMFITELVLDTHSLSFQPSIDDFQIEKKTRVKGPDLDATLADDQHLQDITGAVKEKCHRQHKDVLSINPKRVVGLLLVDTSQLKNQLTPSLLRCLEISSRCPAASARRDARLPVAETPTSLSFSLPPVDVERLRARLISTGPRPVQRSPDELVFTSSMWALQQERRRAAQRPVQPDILPALTRYQERNHPDYIHKMNREKLISAGWKPPSSNPAGHKRTDLSLENRSSDLQLPPLPEHLRETQVQRGQSMFSSTSALKKPRSSIKRHSSISHTPSAPLSNSLLFNSVEEVIRPQIRSPIEIAQVIRNNPHLGFLYMISAEPKSSVKYDPYNLKIHTRVVVM